MQWWCRGAVAHRGTPCADGEVQRSFAWDEDGQFAGVWQRARVVAEIKRCRDAKMHMQWSDVQKCRNSQMQWCNNGAMVQRCTGAEMKMGRGTEMMTRCRDAETQ